MATKREEKVLPEQKDILIQFMEAHPQFATGKLLGKEGKVEASGLWDTLSHELNAAGPTKTTLKWQRVWTDLKTKTKKKSWQIKMHQQQTDGGKYSQIKLNKFEERMAAFLTTNGIQLDSDNGMPIDGEAGTSNVHIEEGFIAEPISYRRSTESSNSTDEEEEYLRKIEQSTHDFEKLAAQLNDKMDKIVFQMEISNSIQLRAAAASEERNELLKKLIEKLNK